MSANLGLVPAKFQIRPVRNVQTCFTWAPSHQVHPIQTCELTVCNAEQTELYVRLSQCALLASFLAGFMVDLYM